MADEGDCLLLSPYHPTQSWAPGAREDRGPQKGLGEQGGNHAVPVSGDPC